MVLGHSKAMVRAGYMLSSLTICTIDHFLAIELSGPLSFVM